MPDLDELYPSRFLKGRTLEQPMTLRIVGVGGEPLEGDDGDKKIKGVLRYKTAGANGAVVEGEIVWNRTNALLAAAALGTRDYTKWSGRLLTIGFDPEIKLGREKVGGIRVVGSPDLKAPLRVEIKRPRRKTPEIYVLQPTVLPGRKPAPTAPPPADPPASEPAPAREPGGEG